MRFRSFIFLVYLVIVLSGCSNTRFLTKDQILYTGRNKVEIINSHNIKNTTSVKNQVSSLTKHKVNNSLFGRRVLPPVGLWVHNYWSTDKSKKFKSWLYKSLSSSPILISDVNPDLRTKKIENDLFDLGYFNINAWSVIDTNKRNPHKARVSYFVDLSPPYHFSGIILDTLTDHLDTLISRDNFRNKIRSGDQFNLNRLKVSRDGLSRRLQDSGYFYFIPEFIELRADTALENNKMNLVIGKRKDLPVSAISVYKINNIIINNSQRSEKDKLKADTAWYDGVAIISSGDILKHELILNSLYIRKGDTYSYNSYQSTMNRLNNLGVFRSVNISYVQNKSDSLTYLLDVLINLVMADNINVDYEANLITKSSGYFGPLFLIGVSNRNTFKGAELLKVALVGGFEWQWGTKSENQLGTHSYQYGISSGLTLPKIVLPFRPGKKNLMLLQRTSVNLDLSLLNRIAYYKMFSTKTNLKYDWSKNKNIQHSIYPIYVNSVNLLETTPEFDEELDNNIYLKKSFEEQFIIGPRYEFSYTNTLNTRPNNFSLNAGINTSGNIIDLIAGIGKDASQRPYYFIGNIYSQYLKLTSDFRYYRNGYNKSLVFRFYAGLGIPYGNSTALPYVEQFFSGGAYSIRAFTARYLGPGSFHTDSDSTYIDQSGDLKLETNLEYRFDISKVLKGALFLETGNIWLVNEDINRPGSKFDVHTFYNQLAVGTGFGLRFDFTFFVLRLDLGLPLRNPYPVDNKYWLFGTDKIFSDGLFNIAIGYPF
jgi:outer membrane protein assembly factor BamA